MTLIFNLLPILIAGMFLFWTYLRWKKERMWEVITFPITLMVIVLFVYFQAQPSYLPKGEIKRSQIVPFEQKDLQIKDVQSKPMSGDERDARREEAYKQPLPFIEKDVDNK